MDHINLNSAEHRGFLCDVPDDHQAGMDIVGAYADSNREGDRSGRERFLIGRGTYAGIFSGFGNNGHRAVNSALKYCGRQMRSLMEDVESTRDEMEGEELPEPPVKYLADTVRANIRGILSDADVNVGIMKGMTDDTGVYGALGYAVQKADAVKLVLGVVGRCTGLRRHVAEGRPLITDISFPKYLMSTYYNRGPGEAEFLHHAIRNRKSSKSLPWIKRLETLDNKPTDYLGMARTVRSEVMNGANPLMFETNCRVGDQILLATDGINLLTRDRLEKVWNDTAKDPDTCQAIVDECAKQRRGKDPRKDITAVLMKTMPPFFRE